MEKNFSIVYDKSLKQYANDLQRIVSKISGIKCMKFKAGKVPDNVIDIDKSYVVYIGKNCSEDLKFKNKFEEYGIRMGWYGTNAWIRVKEDGQNSFLSWLNDGDVSFIADDEKQIAKNAARYTDFCVKYYELYKEYDIIRDKAIDKAKSKTDAIKKMTKEFQFLRKKWIDAIIGYWGLIKILYLYVGSDAFNRIRLFSILYFCKNYLIPFLNEEKTEILNNE